MIEIQCVIMHHHQQWFRIMAESSQIVAKYDRIIATYHYHYEALQIHTKQESSSLITTLCQSFPVPSLPPTSKKRPNYVTSCGSAVEIWRYAGCGKLLVVLRESRTQLPTTETAKFGWLNKKMTPRLSQHFRLAGVIYLENKSWDAFLWIYHI